MRVVRLTTILALSACTQFPELDETIPASIEDADYPTLVPLGPLLATSIPAGVDQEATTQQLEARAASLRNRANALQRSDNNDPPAEEQLQDQDN